MLSTHPIEDYEIYSGTPYSDSDSVYNVNIEHFAILTEDKTCYVYKPIRIEGTFHFDNLKLANEIKNVDYICSNGASSCLVVYADLGPNHKIAAIAHISLAQHVSKIYQLLLDAMIFHSKDAPGKNEARFFLFSGTDSSIEQFLDDEKVNKFLLPESANGDTSSRLLNTESEDELDYDEDIGVFMLKDALVIHQNGNIGGFRIYQQAYALNKPIEFISAEIDESTKKEIINEKIPREIKEEEAEEQPQLKKHKGIQSHSSLFYQPDGQSCIVTDENILKEANKIN